MGWFKKKLNCEHEWFELQTKNEEVEYDWRGFSSPRYDFVYAYCPKCKKTERFYKEDWQLKLKIKEIDKQYLG